MIPRLCHTKSSLQYHLSTSVLIQVLFSHSFKSGWYWWWMGGQGVSFKTWCKQTKSKQERKEGYLNLSDKTCKVYIRFSWPINMGHELNWNPCFCSVFFKILQTYWKWSNGLVWKRFQERSALTSPKFPNIVLGLSFFSNITTSDVQYHRFPFRSDTE